MNLQRHLSIRRILALVSLLFLLLPIGGIYFLRIYESALIRQTESELISQGAFVSAIYKHEIETLLASHHLPHEGYGLPLPENNTFPVFPHLDLAKDTIHPVRPPAFYTKDTLDSVATRAGEQVLPVLKDAQRVTLSGIKILDYQGLVAAGEKEKGLSFSHTQEFQETKQGKPVSFIRKRRMSENLAPLSSVSRNATFNVYVALPIILHKRLIGVVWLNRTPMDLPQALYGKRVELGWTIALLLLITILIARLTSLTITSPVRALVQKTRLIAKGDPEGLKPLHNPITREVSELSDTIAKMATTIQHRTDYIQNFTAHISHEFKTPLTAIRGSVELLQDNLDEMSKAQQKRFLNNIAEDTERLGKLVSRLLELTHADINTTIEQASAIPPLLSELVTPYQTGNFQVSLHLTENQEALRAMIAPESLRAALTNLIENSRQAGATQVEISLQAVARQIVLDIQDNGPGISDANRNDIFTPFFTTRRNIGGTGLGLSITRSLIERYKGRISLQPSTSGAHFRIELPAA